MKMSVSLFFYVILKFKVKIPEKKPKAEHKKDLKRNPENFVIRKWERVDEKKRRTNRWIFIW